MAAAAHLHEWKVSVNTEVVLETAYHHAHQAVFGRKQQQGAALIESNAVVSEVSAASDLEGVGWAQQASLELNAEAEWNQRLALRYVRVVRDVLEAFWQAALTSEHMRRISELADDTLPTSVSKAMYAHLYRRVYKALMESYEAAECEETIEEDWTHDSRGEESITREAFEDGLFELADLCERSAA